MVIKVDNYIEDILNCTGEYIGKPNYIIIKEEKYIELDDLMSTIEELTYELERQIEKIRQMDQEIQEHYVPRRKTFFEYGE